MAVDDGMIFSNPVSGLDRFLMAKNRSTTTPAPYTPEELHLYLETIKADHAWYFPFFLLLARTGMREGEALALKWQDIDFENQRILIRATLTEKKVIEPTKSGKPRSVDMSPEIEAEIKALMEKRRSEAAHYGWKQEPEWVFVNRNGNPLDRGNLTNRVHKPAIMKAGLRAIRIHDLRHTYATILETLGHNEWDIQHQLDHSSIKITKDTYGHYRPGRHKDQIAELDRVGKSKADSG